MACTSSEHLKHKSMSSDIVFKFRIAYFLGVFAIFSVFRLQQHSVSFCFAYMVYTHKKHLCVSPSQMKIFQMISDQIPFHQKTWASSENEQSE